MWPFNAKPHSGISRRDFLRGLGVTAMSVSMGGLSMPSGLIGLDGKPLEPQRRHDQYLTELSVYRTFKVTTISDLISVHMSGRTVHFLESQHG